MCACAQVAAARSAVLQPDLSERPAPRLLCHPRPAAHGRQVRLRATATACVRQLLRVRRRRCLPRASVEQGGRGLKAGSDVLDRSANISSDRKAVRVNWHQQHSRELPLFAFESLFLVDILCKTGPDFVFTIIVCRHSVGSGNVAGSSSLCPRCFVPPSMRRDGRMRAWRRLAHTTVLRGRRLHVHAGPLRHEDRHPLRLRAR